MLLQRSAVSPPGTLRAHAARETRTYRIALAQCTWSPHFTCVSWPPLCAGEGSGHRPGAQATWHAVCVGNVATALRVWDALGSLAATSGSSTAVSSTIDSGALPPSLDLLSTPIMATTEAVSGSSSSGASCPPLLELLLCKHRLAVGGVEGGSVGDMSANMYGSAGRRYGGQYDELEAAVSSYCQNVQRLNPSQTKAVLRAAMPFATQQRPHLQSTHVQDPDSVGFQGGSFAAGSGSGGGAGGADILLVQGPPGTGKTSTTVSLLSVLCGLGPQCGALVVCAPTNAAVAEVAGRCACVRACVQQTVRRLHVGVCDVLDKERARDGSMQRVDVAGNGRVVKWTTLYAA